MGILRLIALSSFAVLAASAQAERKFVSSDELMGELCSAGANLPAVLEKYDAAVRGMCPDCLRSELVKAIGSYAQAPAPATGNELKLPKNWPPGLKNNPKLDERAFGQTACPVSAAEFGRSPHALQFLALEHFQSLKPEIAQGAARALQGELRDFGPSAVIVEGYSSFGCEQALEVLFTPPALRVNDEVFALREQVKAGVRLLPGEPPAGELGIASPDREAFLLLRAWTRIQGLRKEPDTVPSEQELQAGFKDIQKNYPDAASWTLDSFRDWYRKRTGHPFDLRNAQKDTTPSRALAPGFKPGPTNALVDRVDAHRDEFFLRQLASALGTYGKVSVVFGRGHLARQLPALESLLGAQKSRPVARCAGVGVNPPTGVTGDGVPGN